MTQKGRVWMPLGPSPIQESHGGSVLHFNGLVSAIAINPSNPNIMYIGTGGGGVWRTIDGGLNWIPIFDRQLSLGVGGPCGIAIDPINTNIVYVGASRRVNKEPRSGGLFKSEDGGFSWIRLGSDYPLGNTGNANQFFENYTRINIIIVDPINSNTLYLATDGSVLRSTDGGLNWTRGNTPTGILSGDARSLILDTSVTGARILYAGISRNGVFRSNDGGMNWTRILDQTTPAVQAALAALGSPGFGKVLVDIPPPISPPNPAGVQIIYVSLESLADKKNDPVGIFISTDQGATWSQQAGIDLPPNCQGGYSFHMSVEPGSPGDGINDIIYIGCVGQRRSDDSGNNFTKIFTGVHADTHAWAFVRQDSPTPSVVYNGNDGGLAKSTDKGTTWTLLSSGGLQTGLFYNIDVRPDPPGHVTVHLGALQDNGLYTTHTASGLEWKRTEAGGDGGDIKYDGVIDRQVYGSNWGNGTISTRVWLSKDDGLNYPDEITPWDQTFFLGGYLAPIATDPSRGGIVYVSGFQEQWQSFDSGENWRIISRSPLANDIDVSRINGNFVAFCSGGKVFLTTNALVSTVDPTFTDITRNLPSGRNVLRVAFDPNDPSIIYAVLGGFSGFPGGHVFRTNIGASIWTDISPELDVPFSAIALDGTGIPSTIYVGTEFGVLRSIDGGSSWSVLDEIHFPLVPVLDLKIRNGLLRAATYGRGTFAFVSHSGGPVIAVNPEQHLKFGTVHQGPQYLTLQVFNVGLPGSNVEDLIIESVQRLMGSTNFSVLPNPSTPVSISAGQHIDFSVEYNPTGVGFEETATIRIVSNDPTASFVDLSTIGFQESYD